MKTKILIEELQKIDPSGEMEVCVGNQDIWFLDKQPAYYDGVLQVIKNENGVVSGIKYIISGNKISLKLFDLEYKIMDDPDFPVELPDGGGYIFKCLKEDIEKWREESRKEIELTKELIKKGLCKGE